jgi:alanyl-tRNA synthetase
MDGNSIRSAFLRFFEERGHKLVPSSSLISPVPNLLLTTAGMVQFTPYFLGIEEPPHSRAVSAQKSFRTPDIENVGHTARHLTFFEMLGNFSFGDYFKLDAIKWAHQLVTEVFGIDPDRLWATVFETDDEAMGIWVEEVGLPPERIDRRGKFDAKGEPANFWWTHTAGPCGPCSEIFVDRGSKYGPEGGPAVDEERFMEIWNLVFMQDECDDQSNVVAELPKKNIDTGSSLERMAVVLQGVDSVFDTDLLRPLVEAAERATGVKYGADERTDVGLRVMAEHGRATTFLIADGVLPSNERAGYVLRRELRRLITHARKLGADRPVMPELVEATVEVMGGAYPELVAEKAYILQVASGEEERFAEAFHHGISLFEHEARDAKERGSSMFPGEAAFRLHDTFGFPKEITDELATDEGLTVDTDEFARLMEEQRRRGQQARRKGGTEQIAMEELARAAGGSGTEFLGYEHLDAEAKVVGLVSASRRVTEAEEGSEVRLALDRTPFYAEGGGQVGDAGIIRSAGAMVEVTAARPGPGGVIVHEGRVRSGDLREGDQVEARVDPEFRAGAARSHTATHVLHHTLRQFLGEHARQAGSLVEPGRLRFDFTHYEGLSRDAIEEVEGLANRRLADDSPVRAYETTLEFARSQGAIALFGEKYSDIVRVVEVGDYSIELCGGTHVHHTGQVALVRVVSEGSIGSGFRRIEALTGPDALADVNAERRLLQELVEAAGGGDPAAAPERIRHAMARIRQLESERGKIRKAERGAEVERLAQSAADVGGVSLVVTRIDGAAPDELRETALALRRRLETAGMGAAVLGSADDGKALLVASCTKDLIARGITAPALVEQAARTIGGGGGGRKPELAFAGGTKADALPEALASIPGRLAALLAE